MHFSTIDYGAVFKNTTFAILIMAADDAYTMIDVNDAYLSATNTTREDIIGKSVFTVFPGNPTDEVSKNIERTIYSFEQAIRTKKPHTMKNYRYDIPIRGTDEFEERWWTTTNTPILDENGEVKYFIHSPENVTELIKLGERDKASTAALKQQREQLYSTFMQAPVGIAIFKGKDYVVELINPPLCEIMGKAVHELLGRPVFEILDHMKGLGWEEWFDQVRKTGMPYRVQALPTPILRNGTLETTYVNAVYEPFHENDGSINGVIAVITEVTDEVMTKKLIEEAEERARLAVDAVSLGTFDIDLSNGEMTTSTVFANIFGFEKPVSRATYVTAIHPDDLEIRIKAHENALQTGKLLYEVRVIWPDTSIHWIRVEGKVYHHEDGTPTRLLGTVIDMTDQRKAREEQEKLLTLVANSVDLMSILDLGGINSYINEAGRALLGFQTEEEVLKTPISALHQPEDFDFVEKEVLPTVMSDGKWSGMMKIRQLGTGEIIPVFNNCIRINDPVTGEIIGIGAVMRDQRPEMAAKKALAESEELLRSITTASPTGLWVANNEGAFTYVNQTWLDWVGMPFESQLHDGWAKSIHDDDQEKVVSSYNEAIVKQQVYETEFRIIHVDGTIHWCVATGKPQYINGQFIGFIGAFVDISVQKNLQLQKDNFIGIASHELKTPVTSIKAYAQVLERMLRARGDEKEAAMIHKMDAQINRLTSLIGDLLDVTKINSGKLQFNDRAFDFNELVKEVIEELQRTTDSHQLIEDLEPNVVVFGDQERIGQVITNLITNAIKYSPSADRVIIHTDIQDQDVVFCVEDFGIGIEETKLDQVFDQFYRVSNDEQHAFQGLGLGLYISAEIIKREHGRIWVDSELGKGSKFYFSLSVRK
ncbi:MAG: PAS domain S-box protein [Pedobacter sp.]|nr:PAS domain S-box protein [Pedobacter sp.]MDQ8052647.1 PAS domain S-box protein [Pedobacter sp.]